MLKISKTNGQEMFDRMKRIRPNECEEEVSDLPRKQGHSTIMIFVPMPLVLKIDQEMKTTTKRC